jgi:hypothetical protein
MNGVGTRVIVLAVKVAVLWSGFAALYRGLECVCCWFFGSVGFVVSVLLLQFFVFVGALLYGRGLLVLFQGVVVCFVASPVAAVCWFSLSRSWYFLCLE